MKPKSKFFLILGIILLALAIYGYFGATPEVEDQAEAQPKIEITPKDFSAQGGPAPGWDFGEINYGQIVEHSFKIKNLGSEVLEIKRVATSCACTTAKVAQEKINPGEESDLIVTYDTGAMSGAHGKGKQERIIYVKSNDPINPQIEVMIYANVK